MICAGCNQEIGSNSARLRGRILIGGKHYHADCLPPERYQDITQLDAFERALEALAMELPITDEQMFNLIAVHQGVIMEKDAEITRLNNKVALSKKNWIRVAETALAGDPTELRDRVSMAKEPMFEVAQGADEVESMSGS